MYLKIPDKTAAVCCLSLLLALLTPSLESFSTDSYSFPNAAPEYRLTTVVIDAGHGGKDPGCLGSHTREKDIALNIALILGDKITTAFPDVDVIYTRKTDVFIPLHERARVANRAGADLFISIHCNTAGKRNQAIGTETYIMGLHRAKDNLDVAKRENASILLEDDYIANYDGYDPESDEGHILMSMFQNAHLEQSAALAIAIEDRFEDDVKRRSRGVKQAGFLVLRNTAMPSVLVETGFLSHDDDEAFLADTEGQKAIAQGIFAAFSNYKLDLEKHTVVETAQEENIDSDKPFYIQLAASTQEFDTAAEPWNMYENIVVKLENDYYKYLAGPFGSLREANVMREKFNSDGFDGAFVVAYRNDERISVEEAASVARD